MDKDQQIHDQAVPGLQQTSSQKQQQQQQQQQSHNLSQTYFQSQVHQQQLQQQASPHNSHRSGQTQPEAEDLSDEEQYASGDDDSLHGLNNNLNGDGPRKRQKRPLSVS